MNTVNTAPDEAIYPADVAKAIEQDPVATYRAYRGFEADELAKLPDYMQPGLVRFILLGVKPGSFLCAILSDEMELARAKADATNLPMLPLYEHFLVSGCPASCWGSSDKVRAWCERGGLVGILIRG